RPYRIKDYRRLIEHAVSLIPHIGLGTDLMVGFPGESEESFAKTLEVTHDLPFSYSHIFTYSRRPGTAAARLPQSVPSQVARARAHTLGNLSRLKRVVFAERHIGSTLPVLFESGESDGLKIGTTANFLRVAVDSD